MRRNQSYGDMMKELNAFLALQEHWNSDMCVVAILSHGEDGLIFSKDGRQISTEWLLGRFNNDGCPALKGKPKFFILQACRGDVPDYGHAEIVRLDLPDDDGAPLTEADARSFVPRRRNESYRDPTWEDILVSYATIPGYVANRNLYRGTWFVELICKVLFLQRLSYKHKPMESFSFRLSCNTRTRWTSATCWTRCAPSCATTSQNSAPSRAASTR